jgi:hypothetical protein
VSAEHARQADTGRGRVRAGLAAAVTVAPDLKTPAGHAQDPGWFVNRSPKITLNEQSVQACWVHRPGEREASDPGRGTSDNAAQCARDTHAPHLAQRLAANAEQVISENPENGGRARGHWRDGLERFGWWGFGVSIPALLALATLACKRR